MIHLSAYGGNIMKLPKVHDIFKIIFSQISFWSSKY